MDEVQTALTELGAAAADLAEAAADADLPHDVRTRLVAEARKTAADLRDAAAALRRNQKGPPRGLVRKGRMQHRVNK
ncbi:MAG TPA: hypothetical protein VKA46_29635 [Gemmataceae bacterium]|nr:hypothetical protein [Gemmataceae bacterium]